MASLNSTNSTQPTHNISFIGVLIQSCVVVILNIAELHLIRLRWTRKKITNFEIILMNLAMADLLAAVGMLAVGIYGMAVSDKKQSVAVPVVIVVALVLGVFSSIFYLLLIGVERLLAIKLPFKMREWQSQKGKNVTKFMIFTWVVNLSLTTIAGVLDREFRDKGATQTIFGSRTLTYVMSGYIIISTTAIICLYSWISYLVLIRHENFDRSTNNGDKINKVELFTKAIRKERGTLVICILVMVSFVSCNFPVSIRFLVGAKEGNAEAFLVLTNSTLNPLIYFFKGYLEKEYASRKAETATNPNSGQGVELKSPNVMRKQTAENKLDDTEYHGYNGDYGKHDKRDVGLRIGNCKETEMVNFGGQDRAIVTVDKMDDSNLMTEAELESEGDGARGEDGPQSCESSLGDKRTLLGTSFQFQNEWLLETRISESTLSSLATDRDGNFIPENSRQPEKACGVKPTNVKDLEDRSSGEKLSEHLSEESRLQKTVGIDNEAADIDEPESVMRMFVVACL